MTIQNPTDALRLEAAKIIDPAAFLFKTDELMKGDASQYDALRKAERILALAAPASPLPEGGGQCSGISGELDDPRLVEWGYTSLDEAITHLGNLLDNQAAFDGLVRNGKADLQKMQNNTPRNAPRGLSDEC